MRRVVIIITTILLSNNNSYSLELVPVMQCQTGNITINGQVVGSTTFCWMGWEVNEESTGLIPENSGPSGSGDGSQQSQQCYNHLATWDNLPTSCKHLDTGTPTSTSNAFWTAHFLFDFRDMLCTVTSCTNSPHGAFMSQGDNLASTLLRYMGAQLWHSWDVNQMVAVGMPIIQNHCQTLPENGAYDQHDCYQDALDMLNEMNPQSYSLGINWLSNIQVGGNPLTINLNPNAQQTNYGSQFAQKIGEFRMCNNWHNQRRLLCN